MKINYADRKNDRNILKKKFVMLNSENTEFKGKIGLIKLEEVKHNFIAERPNGKKEIVIDNGYKILTYFPEKEAYCCSVMYNKNNKILQWYFDILKSNCKYDNGIPYGEDMFLDVIALPNGEYYTLDEDDLNKAFNDKIVSLGDFTKAYINIDKVENIIKYSFNDLYKFTTESFKKLQKKEATV